MKVQVQLPTAEKLMKENRRLTRWAWAAALFGLGIAGVAIAVPDVQGHVIFGAIACFVWFLSWSELKEVRWVRLLLANSSDKARLEALVASRIKEPPSWYKRSHGVAVVVWVLLIGFMGVVNFFTGSVLVKALWVAVLLLLLVRIAFEVRKARQWKAAKQNIEIEFL